VTCDASAGKAANPKAELRTSDPASTPLPVPLGLAPLFALPSARFKIVCETSAEPPAVSRIFTHAHPLCAVVGSLVHSAAWPPVYLAGSSNKATDVN
jgi:hypothetical protein